AGLNEGSWPAAPAVDPLLAPAVLRALGVPGGDFRIGLSAHDLAAALGAPEVVLSRSDRDAAGPAIPSRFLLRVKALLGRDLIDRHRETKAVELARAIDDAPPAPPYKRPELRPSAEQRRQRISVTALDRLRSDPYQFYAGAILGLRELDALDAEPSAAWRGTVAHEILERWHKSDRSMADISLEVLQQMHAHPLMRALWQPRLMRALEWVEQQVDRAEDRKPAAIEEWGSMEMRGVEIFGKADRIDRMADGTLAIVDYKTGGPPTGREVEAGYALQLGTIGLMAERGAFKNLSGTASRFEYWSLAKSDASETGFGYVATPIREGGKRSGIVADEFVPRAREYLSDALDTWILGDAPFTARLNPDATVYSTFDQLMRLDEWMGRDT
ncbi:MAG: PD-(D/E)XK nuclease family protein, partial [Pontixanthobacter sp.]